MTLYSPSRINLYDSCLLKFHYRYNEKIKEVGEEAIHLTRGTAVHAMYEHYPLVLNPDLKKYKDKDFVRDVLETYFKSLKDPFFKTLLDKKDWIREQQIYDSRLFGFIDYTWIDGSSAIVLDFKTGRFSEEYNWFQIDLYAYYILKKFQVQEFLGMYYFVDHSKKLMKKYTRDHIESFDNKLTSIINKIEGTKDFLVKTTEKHFCPWCPYVDICDPHRPLTKMDLKTFKMIKETFMKKYRVISPNGKSVHVRSGYSTLAFNHYQEVTLDEAFASKHPCFVELGEVKPKTKKEKVEPITEPAPPKLEEGQEILTEVPPKVELQEGEEVLNEGSQESPQESPQTSKKKKKKKGFLG